MPCVEKLLILLLERKWMNFVSRHINNKKLADCNNVVISSVEKK